MLNFKNSYLKINYCDPPFFLECTSGGGLECMKKLGTKYFLPFHSNEFPAPSSYFEMDAKFFNLGHALG